MTNKNEQVKKRLGLINARKEKGMRQEDVAFMLGISRPFYNQIENGKRNVSIKIGAKLESILGVNIKSLR
ncbi:helix-turn-helix domain-containing protein [Rossellomorea sp. H39__3]